MRKRGRPPRLSPEKYVGTRMVFFTANVDGRIPIFDNPAIVEQQISFLRRSCDAFSCTCMAYCFMPDHLHFLIRGESSEADTRKAMIKFKGLSSTWLFNHGYPKLQEDFYDHVLRAGELLNKISYIANNPVVAGLAENYMQYPYSGSFLGPLSEVIHSISDALEF